MNRHIEPWNVSIDDESETNQTDQSLLAKEDDDDSVHSVGSPNVFIDAMSDQGSVDSTDKAPQSPSDREWMKSVFLSNEAIRLNSILHTMHPEDIKNVLLNGLQKKNSKNLVALGILFPRVSYPYETIKHCVRCHRTYNTQSSSHDPCLLSHPKQRVQKLKQDKKGAEFHCSQCHSSFRLQNVFSYSEEKCSEMCEPCFKGVHTASPSDITTDIVCVSCEEYGCVEFYV